MISAFDKFIGYEYVKDELIRFCDVLKHPEDYKQLGVVMPRGILLWGVSGVGKTMLANCFIEESGWQSFVLKKELPGDNCVNRIKETFIKAKEESPAIVFLDGLDIYADEKNNPWNIDEYATIRACMDSCSESMIFVIATAHDIDNLPDFLVHNGGFDRIIEMKCLREEDALKVVETFLGQKKYLVDIDTEEISRVIEGFSYGDFVTLINEAGMFAGYDRRVKIERDDIIKAVKRLLLDAKSSVDPSNGKNMRTMAVHEAGHAVVGEVLEPEKVCFVTIGGYTDSSSGITVCIRKDDYWATKMAQEKNIIRTLGGKAATEVVFGCTDVVCEADLQKVYKIVRRFTEDYCVFGFDAYDQPRVSNFTMENRDRIVAKQVEQYYECAKRIVIEHRPFLDAMVEELINKETLTYKDIRNIRKACENI